MKEVATIWINDMSLDARKSVFRISGQARTHGSEGQVRPVQLQRLFRIFISRGAMFRR